ncbi:type II toxin-antitoxin system RelE/ParE family toxin [Dongia sedimenti]|uniref:Type II toxin-antitoxin system RelE/ParE family toxin n=1 Tax=Dongia sedimenti TaxID=3064282 RepID=A0ABU0YL66_9PROT|nr:type II toxin-antitoxin system RelE/ParE family toxin [Rhodospirillaceae bacterium R-7]
MRIDWSEPARDGLRDIQTYIAQDSPVAAQQFVEKLIAAVERLAQFPESGRHVPESEMENVRELIFGSYRIIYRPETPERVLIVAIVHGHRDLTRRDQQPWKSE